MSIPRPASALLCAAAVLGASLEDVSAQRRKKDDDAWKKDPYTEADPDRMAAAGYVSFGPFAWGDNHDTARIEHVLGDGVKLLWVETAHFKIGSSLPPYKIPHDKTERRKLRDELERLDAKLPAVKPRTRTLDRWLRLHLFAQRLEDTYADFCERIDVKPEDQIREQLDAEIEKRGPKSPKVRRLKAKLKTLASKRKAAEAREEEVAGLVLREPRPAEKAK